MAEKVIEDFSILKKHQNLLKGDLNNIYNLAKGNFFSLHAKDLTLAKDRSKKVKLTKKILPSIVEKKVETGKIVSTSKTSQCQAMLKTVGMVLLAITGSAILTVYPILTPSYNSTRV